MSVNYTKEQQEAIASRGRVIVSASAGSGKTFVMIERLLSLVSEGADIKRVLAVTFTNKAASQMRERLRAALCKNLAEAKGEERARLRTQLAALPFAEISTIHSFCTRLIKTYFYLVDLDPAFRVIAPDDADGKLISARALDETFERFYESGGDWVETLLSVYFHKKKDLRLKNLILKLYDSVRGKTDYLKLLEKVGESNLFEEAAEYLLGEYRERAEYLRGSALRLQEFFAQRQPQAAAVCSDIVLATEQVLKARDLFSLAERAHTKPGIGRIPPGGKLEGEARSFHNTLKKLSAAVKELYTELSAYETRQTEYDRYFKSRSLSKGLASLILDYDSIYRRLKQEAGVLDMFDLEHYACKILNFDDAREEIRKKYDYIFVDEYQDVNPVQEKILSLASGEEVFLVGDAKQSIYGFRGSKSEYFTEKERSFGKALYLTENFRSSGAVLEAVNRVFSRAMTRKSCGVEYREKPMRGGSRYGEHDGRVLIHLIPEKKEPEEPRGIYSVLKESLPAPDPKAEAVADLIEEEFGSEWFDPDEGLIKPIGWGDIAVLVRKKSGDAEKVVSALSARGIPVSTTAAVNVCKFWEARLLIDVLSYLDNPEQDIPLAAALLSRIGGFCEAELVQIRQTEPGADTFREACRAYLLRDDSIASKLKVFFSRTEQFRIKSYLKSAAETADLLLAEGLEAEIAAKRGGAERLRRVRRLLAEGDCPLNEFLRRIKAMDERVEYAESGGADAVKVLTMHAVKGLEFPVVILASLDTPFHGPERDEVFSTDRFLFAPKCYDVENKVVFETVLRRASALYLEKEERKGELNLFYVAMTRAKYRLHLFLSGREGALSSDFASRFSDFLDLEALSDYLAPPKFERLKAQQRQALVYRPEESLVEEIHSVFCQPYAFEESAALPVKSSATELMKELRKEEEMRSGPFLKENGGTVDEGLAYHAFLEHVVFGCSAEKELERMRENLILSKEQLALLDLAQLKKILSLPSLSSLKGKKTLREQTFLVLIPANEILPTNAKDPIVLQGAIDLLTESEEGEFLILDYKFSSRSANDLKESYMRQITVYRKAVSKVFKIEESRIRARIINLKRLEEIEV